MPEAGIEPARPYERGTLSPEGKSIRQRLLIGFPDRNHPHNVAMRPMLPHATRRLRPEKTSPPSSKKHTWHSILTIDDMPIMHTSMSHLGHSPASCRRTPFFCDPFSRCYADLFTQDSPYPIQICSLPCCSRSTKTNLHSKPRSWS
ncbi:hypothetical protein D3C72_1679990 [compost metagenome]